MPISTDHILGVLRQYGIQPLEGEFAEIDLPGIGQIEESESVYTTSFAEIFDRDDGAELGMSDGPSLDDTRIGVWRDDLERIIGESRQFGKARGKGTPPHPPEPYCAWYCPIHFFGHGWGIYIRESCILSHALDIARFVHWPAVGVSAAEAARHLFRSAFYLFFLHEQFHHKVESLGLRLLIATGSDRYRPYKTNVYCRTFNTADCIEESLANAESYRRLREPRYTKRVDPAIRNGLRSYLKKWSIPRQPPGYREGMNFLSDASYPGGLYSLQSQVRDGKFPASTPKGHWSVAPDMITSLADIADDIYVVLPQGGRPIFRPTSIDPGATVSSRALEGALARYHGYRPVVGGKGSHVKLAKPGAPTIVIPGNRAVLSPGVVKHALEAIGGYPISRLPDLLNGNLPR